MRLNDMRENLLFSLDIGTRTVIGTVGIVKDGIIEILKEKYLEHEERAMVDGQIHNINLVAATVMKIKKELEEELEIELKEVSIAAAGRFLKTIEVKDEININEDEEIKRDVIKSLEISAVKKAELEIQKISSGKLYCVGYSVKNYYLNSYLIQTLLGHKGETIGAEIIGTFLPRSVIDSLYTVMDKVDLKVKNLTLEPIAAIEAAVPKKLRLLNIALVDIGAGTSDIAISKDDSISAYGMVPMAGDEVTEVIAKKYLVDFNTAEQIKRSLDKEEISYIDIMGFENKIKSEEVKLSIKNIIKKIATEIGNKIIELNSNKAPSAIFLIGGGAHTPFIIDELSCITGINKERIGIRDRQAVLECISSNELGSAGVTVLGILISSMRKFGEDFINVTLNNKIISLFNSHKHKVLDVLIQEEVKSDMLIGKRGKNIRFYINGKKRLAFGGNGENAKIIINNEVGTIDSEVKDGDIIKIDYAKIGNSPKEKVSNYIDNIDDINISFNEEKYIIKPIILVNGKEKDVNYIILNEDKIEIIYPNKIKDFKNYVLKTEEILYVNGNIVNEEYILGDGDCISTKPKEDKDLAEVIRVTVNDEEVELTGKKEYIFVDIFMYIDFDLNTQKGNIELLLNGKVAAYTDLLKNDDQIKILWK